MSPNNYCISCSKPLNGIKQIKCDNCIGGVIPTEVGARERKIYLVKFINQETGNTKTEYAIAYSMNMIEEEYADIVSVEFISNVVDLTE